MKKIALATALTMGAVFTANCFAAPAPKDEKRHTPQGLYVDSAETYEMMKKDPKVILVDVRTPEEWQFVGYTPMAQIMIPSVKFDYSSTESENYNDKKGRYSSIVNSNFVSQLEEKAAELDADEESTYILMCRSGATRAQPAAKMLDQYGYKNVYIMTDGFEGGKLKEGDQKGYRLKAGWKFNKDLPWTYKIDKDKAYFY